MNTAKVVIPTLRGASVGLSFGIAGLLMGCAAWSPADSTVVSKDSARVDNIVLVHGAWVDGSGWQQVYDILERDGYNVSVVQEPLTSFQDDVAATKRILALQNGPCILVGHSYGGSVITQAGTDPSVVGLVYVAAHMPDSGESEAEDGKRFPSDLAKSNAIRMTPDGFVYLDPAQFHEYFAADLPVGDADFEAHAQALIFNENFKGVISTPAWRSKPSWMIVPTKDRTINPKLERWYAARADSHVTEIEGASHSVYRSRPEEVAAVIKKAAARPQRGVVQAQEPALNERIFGGN